MPQAASGPAVSAAGASGPGPLPDAAPPPPPAGILGPNRASFSLQGSRSEAVPPAEPTPAAERGAAAPAAPAQRHGSAGSRHAGPRRVRTHPVPRAVAHALHVRHLCVSEPAFVSAFLFSACSPASTGREISRISGRRAGFLGVFDGAGGG